MRYIDPDGMDAQETIAGLWHVGGLGMIGGGGIAVLSHGNPGGLFAIGVGSTLTYSGYRSFKRTSSDVSAEFSAEFELFKFQQQILKLASKINPTTVRDFTPEELAEAKLAANSLLATGFLPNQITEQFQNTIAIINAEFKRREEEARKKDEEERKKRCKLEGKEDCV